jgi:hypothetical protein
LHNVLAPARPVAPAPVAAALVSSALHAAALLVLLLATRTIPPAPPEPRSIAVELISPGQFAALRQPPLASLALPAPALPAAGPAPAPVPVPVPQPLPSEAAPQPAQGTIRATELYADGLLAEPASAALRRGLAGTEPRERLVQLCGIEAMEQIRRARPEFDPDIVVAYAFAETRLSDRTLLATGAAFRSRREWYRTSFSCAATADLSGVAGFSFSVGEFVPHEDWDAHDLTAEEIGD